MEDAFEIIKDLVLTDMENDARQCDNPVQELECIAAMSKDDMLYTYGNNDYMSDEIGSRFYGDIDCAREIANYIYTNYSVGKDEFYDAFTNERTFGWYLILVNWDNVYSAIIAELEGIIEEMKEEEEEEAEEEAE